MMHGAEIQCGAQVCSPNAACVDVNRVATRIGMLKPLQLKKLQKRIQKRAKKGKGVPMPIPDYQCRCNFGYTGTGLTCSRPQGCGDCDENAECMPGPSGSFECVCKYGYVGDGRRCTPPGECDHCGHGSSCVHTDDGWTCQCDEGFVPMPHEEGHFICQPIDPYLHCGPKGCSKHEVGALSVSSSSSGSNSTRSSRSRSRAVPPYWLYSGALFSSDAMRHQDHKAEASLQSMCAAVTPKSQKLSVDESEESPSSGAAPAVAGSMAVFMLVIGVLSFLLIC